MECSTCEGPTSYQRAKLLFKYTKKSCRKSVSAKNITFFIGQRFSFGDIFYMAYLWFRATVCAFLSYFRQFVADALETEECVIGGEGIVVEIDEIKMSKRNLGYGRCEKKRRKDAFLLFLLKNGTVKRFLKSLRSTSNLAPSFTLTFGEVTTELRIFWVQTPYGKS
ncbi:Hypothetical protein SRAE_0000064600 [Strongyloides ratti]|uniref:Uncharacterized protein n=1 Tax=Strongyloides ratti TaxID=34506 RepID=A0A090L208_STRRB|nr:Hypothetical protein SRAE_0000064600 [Strongyloides ratti]CEF61524.1 Hypothetical protein SRAE_0000064600 [Strongyloides ratti]